MADIPIRFRIEIKDDSLKEFVYAHRRHQPVRYGFDVEHSEYVEYGTGPQRGRTKYFISPEGRKAINEWVKKKLSIYDPKERRKVVNRIIWKLQLYGMKPQPYWRPARNQVINDLQKYYNMGFTLREVAEQIGAIAKQHIVTQGIPYDGAIERSWYVDDIPRESAINDTTIVDIRSLAEMMTRGW